MKIYQLLLKVFVLNDRLQLISVIIFLFGLQALQAQESINATGGNYSGTGGSLSYSVGQLVYNSNIGTNVSVSEGVQQPYEISEVFGLDESLNMKLSIIAYPNPTVDFLELIVTNGKINNMNYQLSDIKGILLQNEKIISQKTKIKMDKLISGVYFVKVLGNKSVLKVFKVIKK